jgi:dTDP-4-dehydrorhamnose reductase
MIMRIAELDQCGIFHCCGGQVATRLDLARATAQVFGLDPDLIRPGSPERSDPASLSGIPVPKDTSVDIGSTARRLAYQPSDLVESLHKLRQQLETGQI